MLSKLGAILIKIETSLLNFGVANAWWFVGAGILTFVYYRTLATEWLTIQANRIFGKAKAKDAAIEAKEQSLEEQAQALIKDAKNPQVDADWNKK